jgi:hypothetical protein
MSQNNVENIEIEKEVEAIQQKKKQLSQKQLEYLNNIRVKHLKRKKKIKLNERISSKKPKNPQLYKKKLNQNVNQNLNQKLIKKLQKRVIKKVIRYVETDSDDDDEEGAVKNKNLHQSNKSNK